jgi:hypothetical protein
MVLWDFMEKSTVGAKHLPLRTYSTSNVYKANASPLQLSLECVLLQ